jgi:hypothetical protein
MSRVVLLLLVASVGLAAEEKKPAAGGFVLVLQRSGGGFFNPKDPLAQYGFKVGKDGGWEFKGTDGKVKKGKIKADALEKWLKDIKDGSFDKLKHNPALGAADQPFMDITITVKGKTERKRISLGEKLAKAIEKKVVEVVKLSK